MHIENKIEMNFDDAYWIKDDHQILKDNTQKRVIICFETMSKEKSKTEMVEKSVFPHEKCIVIRNMSILNTENSRIL